MHTHEDFTTSIQLSHLLATEIGVMGDEATIIDTIDNATYPITTDNLQQAIADIFHVNMSAEKMLSAVNSLMKQHKLYQNGQILLISPQTLEEISKMSLENERIEKAALEEWVSAYQTQENIELCAEDAKILCESILSFIRTLFLKHGADCYKFITGEKQTEYYDISTVAQATAVASKLLEKDRVEAFLCSIFTQGLSGSQTSFLLNQIKKAIHYLSMVVDHTAKTSILDQMAGVSLYLDTTILYRLFDLQGEKRYNAINQLVSFCQKSNIKLKVFETTVDELKRRIAYDARVIINHPIPTSFARIGYKCRTAENYISTFWREAKKTGVSAEDFNYRYSDVIALLESHGIEIDRQDYIFEFDLGDTVNNLRGKVVKFSSSDPEFEKSPNALDHDAKCLAMVAFLQDKSANSAIEAKTVFLSSDWSLVRLQRFDKEYKDKNDMVVLPSQLMQRSIILIPLVLKLSTLFFF